MQARFWGALGAAALMSAGPLATPRVVQETPAYELVWSDEFDGNGAP